MSRPMRDLSAERAVLGAMLLREGACRSALARLSADSFYLPSHGRVFEAIALANQLGGVDAITVSRFLSDEDKLIARSVASDVPATTNAPLYIDQVLEAAAERRQVEAAQHLLEAAGKGDIMKEERQRLVERLAATLATFPLADRPPFAVYSTSDLSSIPPPEFLIEEYLVRGALNILFGSSDRYKSFIALDWSCSIAAGMNWFGREVKQGPVVYVAAEGGSGLWQRVEAWAASRNTSPPEMLWIPEPINMFDATAAAAFSDWVATLPVAPLLLVFDTAARCMVGADENSNRDVGVVIDRLDEIRRRHGSAVLGVTHSGHEDKKRERGASALGAAADVRVMASGTKPLSADLSVIKMKDSERAKPITLYLDEIESSLAVARVSATPRTNDRRDAIVEFLTAHPASSQSEIETALGGNHAELRVVLHGMVDSGEVQREPGPRKAFLHSIDLTSPSGSGAVGRGEASTPAPTAPHAPRSKGGVVAEAQAISLDLAPPSEPGDASDESRSRPQ